LSSFTSSKKKIDAQVSSCDDLGHQLTTEQLSSNLEK